MKEIDMRIRFTHNWDHITPQVTTAYKEGTEVTVAKEVGDAAIAAGRAVEKKAIAKVASPVKAPPAVDPAPIAD
jgi:ketosteroid isomerase-like protein